MGDAQYIPKLLTLASDTDQLIAAQHVAAKRLLDFDGEVYPSDGCAITLCVLLQEAGIAVPDTFQAITLGNFIEVQESLAGHRSWRPKRWRCWFDLWDTAHHGFDHIYLVLKVLNSDEMVVADNQQANPHFRFASGKGGKTPTKSFFEPRDN
jgi:hypothetical protein